MLILTIVARLSVRGWAGDVERLMDAVNRAPTARHAELPPQVRQNIDDFVKGADPFDDITMPGLRFKGCIER